MDNNRSLKRKRNNNGNNGNNNRTIKRKRNNNGNNGNNGNSNNSGNTANYMRSMGFNMNINGANGANGANGSSGSRGPAPSNRNMNDGTWYNYRVALKSGVNGNNRNVIRTLRYRANVPVKEYNLVEPEEIRGTHIPRQTHSSSKKWKERRNTIRKFKLQAKTLREKINNGSITPAELSRLQLLERMFGPNNSNLQAVPKPNGNRKQRVAHQAAEIFARHNTLNQMLANHNLVEVPGQNNDNKLKRNIKEFLQEKYSDSL